MNAGKKHHLFTPLLLLSLIAFPYPNHTVSATNQPKTQIIAQNNAELEEANQLEQKVVELYEQGKYQEAIPLAEKVLAIREKNLGSDHVDVAKILNKLAELYLEQGNYTPAEPIIQRSLSIREKAFGKDHPDVAESLNNLAELYLYQGNYTTAEPLIQRSLSIREKAFGKDHPDVAESLNNLALLYYSQGNYTTAEPLYQRSLSIREKALGKDHPDVAESLIGLALLYYSQGKYSAAEPLYQRSISILEKALGKDHPNVAIALNNLAVLYQDQGKYSAAEPLYQRSLSIYEKALGKDHPTVATALSNLANLYQAQGDYSAAEPLYQRSLSIFEKALGKDHPNVAIALNNLAVLYENQGNYSAADPLYQRSISITEKALGKDHPDVATSLSNLARLSWANDNIPRTLEYLTRSTEIEETNLTSNLPSLSEARKTFYFDTFNSTKYITSLHLQYALDNQAAAQLSLTTILRRKGRILDSATDTLKTLRQNLTPANQKLLNQLSQIRTQLASLTYTGIGNKTVAEYQKELTNLETQAQQIEQTLSQNSTAFRTENQKITIEAVQKNIPAEAVLIEFTRYQPYNSKTDKYDKAHYAAYTLDSEGKMQWVDLGDSEALDKEITIFKNTLQTPNETIPEVQSIARSLDSKLMQPVRKLIGDKKQLLISPDSQLNLIPFAALVDENNQYLVENYHITYLTSGRDLIKFQNIVPFQQSAVIIANPDFQNSPDTSVQIASRGNTRSVDLAKLDWCCTALSGTEAEAKEIAPLLTRVSLYTGKQASKSVLETIKAPIILHFATHGFFLEDEPDTEPTQGLNKLITDSTQKQPNIPKTENPLLRSGIALTGFDPAHGKLDGALTALELANLNLYGTKLVVLSACRTGVGTVRNGEGVYGLRRSLVLAGAESQLISLWNVADEGTKHLMVNYYQRLIKQEERGEALRQVQLEMLKSQEYQHPFFWSAFIPSGNWRSMDFGK